MGLIRFLLAVAVVFVHCGHSGYLDMVGGKLAVELFYIFSGFYMALILNEKYVGLKMYKVFITNRMLKLYPVYWAVAFFVVLFSIYIAFDTHWHNWGSLYQFHKYGHKMSVSVFAFLISSNLGIFCQDIIMFLKMNTSFDGFVFTENFRQSSPQLNRFLLIPQAWTVALELTFYLVAPFIARKNIVWILLLAILSLACKFTLASAGYVADPWSYRFFLSELHLFLLGILAYRMYRIVNEKRMKRGVLYSVLVFNITLILICDILRDTFFGSYTDMLYITLLFLSIPFIFQLSKEWKFDARIGELSYPIYISHMFLIYFIGYFYKSHPIEYWGWIIVGSSVCFSIVLNKLILYPVDKYRQSRVKKRNI